MLCPRLIRLAAYVRVLVTRVQWYRETVCVDGLAATLAASFPASGAPRACLPSKPCMPVPL